eukprot:g40052.t1
MELLGKMTKSLVREVGFEEHLKGVKAVRITEEEGLEVLENTKMDKSSGSDPVYPGTLLEVREEIARPLAEIFVSSITMKVTKKINDGRVDFSKAFDKIPHARLISKGDRVFGMLAFIAQTIEYMSWDVMLRLYRTLGWSGNLYEIEAIFRGVALLQVRT